MVQAEIGNLAILGSTGSIGQSALDLVRHNRESFRVVALAAGSNIDLLQQQIDEFKPALVAVADSEAAAELRKRIPATITVLDGPNAASVVAVDEQVHTVLAAVVGFAGLHSTLAAIEAGKHIALANKESLVAGGALVRQALNKSSSCLIPVDSEHCSLFQCLMTRRDGESVRSLTLTASGGPFLNTPIEDLHLVTAEQALKHPRWEMGAKISIDSATMMNKALEIIEAHWLFEIEAEKIKVLVHPQSIIHGIIEYDDGNTVAVLHETDMRVPISFALGYLRSVDPARHPGRRLDNSLIDNKRLLLDLAAKPALEFLEPDANRFPALQLAYRALKLGKSAPCVLNAANEVAVAEFLKGNCSYVDIPRVCSEVLECSGPQMINNFEQLRSLDSQAREFASQSRVFFPGGEKHRAV